MHGNYPAIYFLFVLGDYLCESHYIYIIILKMICYKAPFTRSKNYLDRYLDRNLDSDVDRDNEDVPVYTGHSLFNTTKPITLLSIVTLQSIYLD